MGYDWLFRLVAVLLAAAVVALLWRGQPARSLARKQKLVTREKLVVAPDEVAHFDRLWGDRDTWSLCALATFVPLALMTQPDSVFAVAELIVVGVPWFLWWSTQQSRLQTASAPVEPAPPATLADFVSALVRVSNAGAPGLLVLFLLASRVSGVQPSGWEKATCWAMVALLAAAAAHAELVGRRLVSAPRSGSGSPAAQWHDALRRRAIEANFAATWLALVVCLEGVVDVAASQGLPSRAFEGLNWTPGAVAAAGFLVVGMGRGRHRRRTSPDPGRGDVVGP